MASTDQPTTPTRYAAGSYLHSAANLCVDAATSGAPTPGRPCGGVALRLTPFKRWGHRIRIPITFPGLIAS